MHRPPRRGEALPRPPRHRRGKHPWHASPGSTILLASSPSPNRRFAGLTRPAGQALPDPYRTGEGSATIARTGCTGDAPPRHVGARRCLARRATGAATTVARIDHVAAPPGTRPSPHPGFPALAGRRVRHRLTPTHDAWHRPMAGIGRTADAASHPVGARRCLARRATGAATPVATPIPSAIAHATVDIRPHRQFWPCEPAG
jgi:hypothetical protein